MRWLLGLAVLASLQSCQGLDAARLRAERANHALATRCADGWFQGLSHTEADRAAVRKALADWESAIAAEERLAIGGGK